MVEDEEVKKCAIYLRVSTEEQHPENQIADVRKLAEALKYEVFETYIDKESGSHSDRQEFQRMMTDAESHKFQTLFIWALDRFSREGIETTLSHIKRLKDAGVVVKSYQESWLDTSIDGISELLIAVLSYAAKEELKRFRERSMAGKKTMLANKELIGCYPPYGYNHIKRDKKKGIYARFEINEPEAQIVRLIFNLYLQFKSIFLVAKELKNRGIKTRGKGGRPKYFQTSMVSKILKRETYIGNHYYGKTSPCVAKYHINKIRKHKLTGRKKNPKSEWKLVKVSSIIDEKTFYKVQEVMENKFNMRHKESKYSPLCQGLIKCVRCGRSYGVSAPNNFPIYRCSQAHGTNFNEPPCKSHSKSMRKLDEIIWNFIRDLVKNKDKVKDSIRILRERREIDRDRNQKTYNSLIAAKNEIKQEKTRIIHLAIKKKYDEDILDEQMKELDDKEKMVNNQIREAERELQGIDSKEKTENEIERVCLSYEKRVGDKPLTTYTPRLGTQTYDSLGKSTGPYIVETKTEIERAYERDI